MSRTLVPRGWFSQYEADALPTAATPAWTKESGGTYAESVDSGILNLTCSGGGYVDYYRTGLEFSDADGFRIETRVRINTAGSVYTDYHGLDINPGSPTYATDFIICDGAIGLDGTETFSMDTSDYHVYKLKVLGDRTDVYVDGVKRLSKVVTATSGNPTPFIYFAAGWGGETVDLDIDYLYYGKYAGGRDLAV